MNTNEQTIKEYRERFVLWDGVLQVRENGAIRKATVEDVESFWLQKLEEEREEMVKKLETLKFQTDIGHPDYWNKGFETDQRAKDVLDFNGGLIEAHNSTVDQAINLIKKDNGGER